VMMLIIDLPRVSRRVFESKTSPCSYIVDRTPSDPRAQPAQAMLGSVTLR
jgi:hypothetical protein